MKLTDIFEGVSAIVFHATAPQYAVAAVEQHKMRGFELNGKFILSLARSRTGEYPEYMGDDMIGSDDPIVVLEMNGTRLGQRYKGQPIDSGAPEPGEFDFDDYKPLVDYTEDRIFNKTQDFAIPTGTFIRAHLIENGHRDAHAILSAVAQRLQVKIPCVFYKTVRDFQSNHPIKQPVAPAKTAVDPTPFMNVLFGAMSGKVQAKNQFRAYTAEELTQYMYGIADRLKQGDPDLQAELNELRVQLMDEGHVESHTQTNTLPKLIDAIKQAL